MASRASSLAFIEILQSNLFKFFIIIIIVRGPASRPGGQGPRMGNNIVVSQQRQQQNQTMPQAQPQLQNLMYVQPFMPLNFGKFPAGNTFNTHTVS